MPNPFDKFDQATRDKIMALGLVGVGIYLFWTSRPSSCVEEQPLQNLSDDEITRRVRKVLTRSSNVGVEHNLSAMERKIARRAALLDPEAVRQGTEIELLRIEDPLIAKNTAVRHLSADPHYYDLEESVDEV